MGQSEHPKDHTSLFSESSTFLFSESTTLLISNFMTLLFSGYIDEDYNKRKLYFVDVGGYDDMAAEAKLVFTTKAFLDEDVETDIKIDLGYELFNRWFANGAIGDGFEIIEDDVFGEYEAESDRQLVNERLGYPLNESSRQILRLVSDSAWISGIDLYELEKHTLGIEFFKQYKNLLLMTDTVVKELEEILSISSYVKLPDSPVYNFTNAQHFLFVLKDPGDSLAVSENLNTNVIKQKKINVFNVFPNPAFNNLTLEFSLDEVQDVSLNIFDSYGRIVEANIGQNFRSGNNSIDINIEHLASGIYYINLTTLETTITKKLVINR
jgi:hypothetical protein